LVVVAPSAAAIAGGTGMIRAIIVLIPVVAVYWLWVRPLLKSRPGFAEFYQREESLFTALRLKFAGIKEKLTAALVVMAASAVELHDRLAPVVAGIDVTPLTSMVPQGWWPYVVAGTTAAMLLFRVMAEKRAE
jgi:hypothetical protein